jgi:hypothetical protein
MGTSGNPHNQTGANAPKLLIWLLVAAFLTILVVGVNASKGDGGSPAPTPTASAS